MYQRASSRRRILPLLTRGRLGECVQQKKKKPVVGIDYYIITRLIFTQLKQWKLHVFLCPALLVLSLLLFFILVQYSESTLLMFCVLPYRTTANVEFDFFLHHYIILYHILYDGVVLERIYDSRIISEEEKGYNIKKIETTTRKNTIAPQHHHHHMKKYYSGSTLLQHRRIEICCRKSTSTSCRRDMLGNESANR